jgi:hypothetical protein
MFGVAAAVAAPEPSTLALIGAAAIGLLGYMRRRVSVIRAGHLNHRAAPQGRP